MNGLKFDFSKLFWGGTHRAPPQTPPQIPALVSSWASPSILIRFAPSTWVSPSNIARFALLIRASIGAFGFAPSKRFLDPPLILYHLLFGLHQRI